MTNYVVFRQRFECSLWNPRDRRLVNQKACQRQQEEGRNGVKRCGAVHGHRQRFHKENLARSHNADGVEYPKQSMCFSWDNSEPHAASIMLHSLKHILFTLLYLSMCIWESKIFNECIIIMCILEVGTCTCEGDGVKYGILVVMIDGFIEETRDVVGGGGCGCVYVCKNAIRDHTSWVRSS